MFKWILLALVLLVVGGFVWMWAAMIRMPGHPWSSPLPAPDAALEAALRSDVEALAGRIGSRHVGAARALEEAADHLRTSLEAVGYEVLLQTFQVNRIDVHNIEVVLPGTTRPDEIVVIGAHYDTVSTTPGADDNASGVAALLALARSFQGATPERTVRFVWFVNEEQPHFETDAMGSLVYARRCRERGENVVAMLSLESIGYFDTAQGSQHYPFPLSIFYPSTGDFLGFVGDRTSAALTRRVVAAFREKGRIPSIGAALPAGIPGVGWSDQWSFWQVGYPGVMVTGTAPFRNPHYHQRTDTPDQLDYPRLALSVEGLDHVVRSLARVGP